MKVAGIIPARLASTRLPGKPLIKLCGKSMIEHVYRRSCLSGMIDDIYVATCDMEIAAEVESFNGKVLMTAPEHKSGMERVSEAAQQIDAELIVNIQGDEPLVCPDLLDKAVCSFQRDDSIQCLNFVSVNNEWNNLINPNIVKVVLDQNNRALYLSRSPIPYDKKENFQFLYRQMGIYLMRRELLMSFSKWGETPLENKEGVDILRFIEHGIPVNTFISPDTLGVDTSEDVILAEKAILNDPLYRKIFTA